MCLEIGIFSVPIAVKDLKIGRRLAKCPKCDSSVGIREILYGMPAEEPDSSKYIIGGCLFTGNDPKWACINCGWEGHGSSHKPKEIDF